MTDLWPADRVERKRLSDLKPYEQNARTHSDSQIDQIAASIREFGFAMPLLIDEQGELIAGHGRAMAAQRLGLDEVPVMIASGWTQRQIKAYRIADNQLALNAGWDVKILADELQGLTDLSELMGFTTGELEEIFAAAGTQGGVQAPAQTPEEARKTLAERFGLPPFTVLNAREGWWQTRKQAWIALGIQSEIGRGDNLLHFSETANEQGPGGAARKRQRLAKEKLQGKGGRNGTQA